MKRSKKSTAALLFGIIASGLLGMWTAPIARAADAPAARGQTVVPTDDYQVAWLTLDNGWGKGGPMQVMLGIRGGQVGTVWYVGGQAPAGTQRIWSDELAVKLDSSALKGQIKGRLVSIWAPIADIGDFVIDLDATGAEGKFSGKYSIKVTGKQEQAAAGTVSGTLQTEKQLGTEQAFPAGKDWSNWYGGGTSLHGPTTGAKLVGALKDCRPIWKSEEFVPCAWGNGPDGRYKNRVIVTSPTSGASSPVMVGGKVYQFYYRPSGELSNEDALMKEAASVSSHPIAQKWYTDWHRQAADDIFVCIDGSTGKTVWKTTFSGRATNVQTHKWRRYNPTPLVVDDVLYCANYANWVYAIDAKTGKLVWEYNGTSSGKVKVNQTDGVGPILADGVLILPGSVWTDSRGLDPKTGKELWKGPRGLATKWTNQGKEFAVVGKACIEPKTGKTLWTIDDDLTNVYYTPLLEGDYLVGIVYGKTEAEGGNVICYRLKQGKAEKLWSLPGPKPMVDTYGITLNNGYAYVDGEKEMFCIKLDDGKIVATAAGAGGARTQHAFAADGRIFIQPEGRHGSQSFLMLDANPQNFKLLGDEWKPPHPHTTAYAFHPITSPLVDGRLIIRGMDGIYCYDLRKAGK